MWPQALQMTRDECRGILRRLELESYSQVISVFRAQGGLSESKTKLLEELRGVFHISQERHRAESRRVANDEELATIAEAISGPNTWQEWAREGRRTFPMLPRVPPQTALALLANSVACETAAANAKLAFPANTAAVVAEEQAAFVNSAAASGIWDASYIVTSDPFKMPEIPVAGGTKKNLKRNISDNPMTGSSKKRNVGSVEAAASPTKQQQQQHLQHQHQQLQQQQKQYQHITANMNVSPQTDMPPTSNIRKLYHNHNKLQQQRYLQQQQQQQAQTKPKATKKNANAGAKRQATPAKSGRRAQKQQEQQLQKQLLHQQQQLLQQQQQQVAEQQHQQIQLQLQHAQQQQTVVARNLTYIGNPATSPPTTNLIAHFDEEQIREYASPTAVAMPQIAASKKDITKNLTKLQIPATVTPMAADGHVLAHTQSVASPNAVATGAGATPPPLPLHGKATPVQKYIVEDRQPQPMPQIMTLPQMAAAATKLRAVNTTILPPGTKLTTTTTTAKKLVSGAEAIASGGGSSQPQVFNIIDGTTTITTNASQTQHAAPTHMPPAVIQLHGAESASQQPLPAQGKVLTTKLLPVVLSGSTSTAGGAHITKIETLNNGATLLNVSGASTVTTTSSSSNATMSGTIIKNLPSSMLISGGASCSSGTIISTLGAGATVFRKPPNIIKTTGIIGMGTTSKLSSTFNAVNTSNIGGGNGPQIISNVKLTPAISTAATVATTQQHQQFLHQQLKNVTTTGIRTSVKICQSLNGKMIIQPANLDAASKAKFAAGGALQHKLLAANTLIGCGGGLGTTVGSSGIGGTTTTTPQRIAIQKVQIIPAPLANSATGVGVTLQKPTTLTLSGVNKSNMIFVPASSTMRVGVATPGTLTLTKTGQILQAKSPLTASADASKPNVVIIGAAPSMPHTPKSPRDAVGSAGITKLPPATFIDSSGGGGSSKISEMITEDTPVDILSMPIIVDDGSAVGDSDSGNTTTTLGNNIGDTVTVLASNIIETTSAATKQQQPPTVILGATDWEMELDQATAKARSGSTQRRSTGSSSRQRKSTGGGDGAIVLDDHFEDVIVVEQQEDIGDETGNEKPASEVVGAGGQITTIASGDDIIMLGSAEKLKVTAAMTMDEDETALEVIDEADQKQSTLTAEVTATFHMQQEAVECETDAGFDETIDMEIDENTAIEYIEEEHGAAGEHYEDNNGKSDTDAKQTGANSGEDQHDRPTSSTAIAGEAATSLLEEDDKNNTINCRFSEIISSSGDESDANAFVFAQELEAGTLATTGTAGIRSHDEP